MNFKAKRLFFMNYKAKKLFIILLVLVGFLLIPFDVDTVNMYGVDVTAYNAALYSVVKIEAFGFTRTKICFFPENLDVKNNIYALSDLFGN